MFVSSQCQRNSNSRTAATTTAAQQQAAAMQEIEVISMDDGEDNVTATSLSSPPSMSALSSSCSQCPATTATTAACSREEAMETLLVMISNETTLPTLDHRARSRVKATPISTSGIAHDGGGNNSGNGHHRGGGSGSGMMSMNTNCDDEDDPVNDHDRTKMCDWYYEMSDFLKIDRATASRALTLLDRFMAAPVTAGSKHAASIHAEPYNVAGVVVAASVNRDEYQLAALTALFLAIKLFERLNIQPEHVSYLSRGRYTSSEVVGMESIMLAALEWRACAADKADYVDALLDVCFPNGVDNNARISLTCEEARRVEDSMSDYERAARGLRELAGLQIQLSDFESAFSTQRRSLVAFAAVINAFEMRKDGISNVDQRVFLETVQSLMNRLYPTARDREEVARTVERLRVLVDPSTTSVATRSRNEINNDDVNLTPTSMQQQRYPHHAHAIITPIPVSSSSSSSSSSSTAAQHVQVSPLDVALESMENFDVARILCCGSHGQTSSCRSNAMASSNGSSNRAIGNNGLLESVSSFGSVDNATQEKIRRAAAMATSDGQSPTTIATILYGNSR